MANLEYGSTRRAIAILASLRGPEWGLVFAIAAILAVIAALDRSGAFFNQYNQMTLMHQIALYGVLAIGETVVIIAGGIDLSIGAVVALASVISAKLVTEWLPVLVASLRGVPVDPGPPPTWMIALGIALTLLMGLGIGLAHAGMISRLRLPPFIATLATMAGLRSLATIISTPTITVPFDAYRVFGRNPWWTLAVFQAIAVSAGLMMGRTVLGRHLYALGGNESAARLSGLPTRRLKAIAYGLSGLLAALGGILFSGRSGQGDSKSGLTYELYAITAAVVGGCSLSGGVGSIRGTVLGLILIQVVIKGTGQVVHGIDSTQVEGLVLGTVVVLSVAFNQRFRSRG